MYRRYYDGYSASNDGDTGEIIIPRNTDNTYLADKKEITENEYEDNEITQTETASCNTSEKKSLFSLPGELDDIILIGLLLMLIMDSDNDDPIILIIIGFILLADFI